MSVISLIKAVEIFRKAQIIEFELRCEMSKLRGTHLPNSPNVVDFNNRTEVLLALQNCEKRILAVRGILRGNQSDNSADVESETILAIAHRLDIA